MAWDPPLFQAELKPLWNGFTRQTIQQKLRAPRHPTNPTNPTAHEDPTNPTAHDEIESDAEMLDEEEDEDGADSKIEAEEDDDPDKFKQGKEPCLLNYFARFVLGSWRGAWLMPPLPCVFWCIHGILLARATIPQGSGSVICHGTHLIVRRSISSIQKLTSLAVASEKRGAFTRIPSDAILTTSSCWHCTLLQPSQRINPEVGSCSLAQQIANQAVSPTF